MKCPRCKVGLRLPDLGPGRVIGTGVCSNCNYRFTFGGGEASSDSSRPMPPVLLWGMVGVVLLAILAGIGWFTYTRSPGRLTGGNDDSQPTTVAALNVENITADRVQSVEITKSGETTTLTNEGPGWVITTPKRVRADAELAGALVGVFATIRENLRPEDSARDRPAPGAATPPLRLKVSTKDGRGNLTLSITNEQAAATGFFLAKVNDYPHAVLMSSGIKAILDKTYVDLQDRRLLPLDYEHLRRVELTVGGQTVGFEKNGQNEWQVPMPRSMRAEGGFLGELLRRLMDARIDSTPGTVAIEKRATAFAKFATVGVVKATDAAHTERLEIRQGESGVYLAKSSAVEGVHEVSTGLGDRIKRPLSVYLQHDLRP